jgi:hypothetical protein
MAAPQSAACTHADEGTHALQTSKAALTSNQLLLAGNHGLAG